MGALERIDKYPDWPARMTAPVAAAYMGVSQSTFLTRFGGIGVKEGGNTFWARVQLDKIVADQFHMVLDTPAQPSSQPVDEFAAWEAEFRKG